MSLTKSSPDMKPDDDDVKEVLDQINGCTENKKCTYV